MASVYYASASELATLTHTFTAAGVPADPTTVTLTITDPTGTATIYTYAAAQITKTATGIYSKDVASLIAGEWQYLWVATGPGVDAQAGTWMVEETELGHLYITPAGLRSRIGLAATDTSADLELHGACFAASRSVEQDCGRVFWRSLATAQRTIAADSWHTVRVPSWADIVSVASLATDADGDGVFETTWAAGDYQLTPVDAATAGPEPAPYLGIRAVGSQTFPVARGMPGERLERVRVTGVFGWPAVPAAVRAASAIVAAELFRLKDAPFGVVSFGEMGVVSVRPNPVVARLLAPYRRTAVLIG